MGNWLHHGVDLSRLSTAQHRTAQHSTAEDSHNPATQDNTAVCSHSVDSANGICNCVLLSLPCRTAMHASAPPGVDDLFSSVLTGLQGSNMQGLWGPHEQLCTPTSLPLPRDHIRSYWAAAAAAHVVH